MEDPLVQEQELAVVLEEALLLSPWISPFPWGCCPVFCPSVVLLWGTFSDAEISPIADLPNSLDPL